MYRIKQTVKKIPGAPALYDRLVDAFVKARLKKMSTKEIFSDIYHKGSWVTGDSLSGPGSEIDQTRAVAAALPSLFTEYGISTILDIPCGDFHWMRTVDLHAVDYLRTDIVGELIQHNQVYEKNNIRFCQMDLLDAPIPQVDLILCRDCLIHFSFNDIRKALNNISQSKSNYLLTTTYVDRTANQDILTGQFRVLNLQLAPFCFPPPLYLIREESTEKGGKFWDKSLGLWKIADLPIQ